MIAERIDRLNRVKAAGGIDVRITNKVKSIVPSYSKHFIGTILERENIISIATLLREKDIVVISDWL